MLKRIHYIKNIGRFENCSASGCEFDIETIIFALNTHGKSTLTTILRSIQSGNNNLLIGRKTFGSTAPKKIEIDFIENLATEKYVFQNKAWNKINPNILIFDSKFIIDNIFEGESITYDQQKRLSTIIIGKQGQELNEEIVSLQELGQEFAAKKSEKTIEFSRCFPKFELSEFRKLKQDQDIDKKIIDKTKEIKFEKEREENKKLIEGFLKDVASINFEIKEKLEKTLDIKQDEIDKHIREHFSNEENARSFLNEGLEFLKKKSSDEKIRSCVFCGQLLGEEAEALISMYAKFFKGGYAELQDEINKAIGYFKGLNIESLLIKISTELKNKDIDISLDEKKINELSTLKNAFEVELNKKRDLNYKINFDSFEHLKTALSEISQSLENIKEKVETSPSQSLDQLEDERVKLEGVKKRFEKTWVDFCSELDDIDKKANEARDLREQKRKELEAYSSSIFDTHKKTINNLCREMGADFEIDDFNPLRKIIGQTERIFAIKFFGTHKVDLKTQDDGIPNFKNTLSESDKRLLALAFFLSLLCHDKDIGQKVIVFDDPMSSFDSERRRKTTHLVTDIAYRYKGKDGKEVSIKPKQKIILTHEDRFAKELARTMQTAKTFKIEEYVEAGNKRSKIVPADFPTDFPDDETIEKIERIKSIFDNRQFAQQFELDCRLVLENIFKRKYYFDLKEDISNKKGVRTFVVKLNELGTGGFEIEDKFKKFIRLCNDLNIEMHDNCSTSSSGDKESILKDFFDCLKNI